MLLEPCSQMLPPNPHAHGPDPTVFFWGCVFQPCLQDARGGTAPPSETVFGIRSVLRCYEAIYQIWVSRPQNHLITEEGEEVRRASRVTSTEVVFLSRLEESRGNDFDWLLHQRSQKTGVTTQITDDLYWVDLAVFGVNFDLFCK
jgi:hypothetical protein